MAHYRKKRRIPTELTWEEKNPKNYLFKPSRAFARIEKMDRTWVSIGRTTGRVRKSARRENRTSCARANVERRNTRSHNRQEPRP